MRVDGRFYAAMVAFILLSVLLGEARRIVALVVQVNVYVRVSKCVRVADMSKDICHKHNVILVLLLFSNTDTDRAIDTQPLTHNTPVERNSRFPFATHTHMTRTHSTTHTLARLLHLYLCSVLIETTKSQYLLKRSLLGNVVMLLLLFSF